MDCGELSFCILPSQGYLCLSFMSMHPNNPGTKFKQINKQEMKKGIIKLSSLTAGKSAVIIEFAKDDLHIKLMEMGCVPGETVKIEKIAPMGDPISILVAGYNLSLRKTEADHIFVEEI